MLAIRQQRFGGPEELRLEDVPLPSPGQGEARIAVAAAGVHLIDCAVRRGESAGPLGVAQLPMTPGREVAGTVNEIGPGVGEELLGRSVAVDLGARSGGYAEHAIGRAERLHELPAGVTPADAVTMVGTGRTAVAILELASVQPGETVLVTATAGRIGSLLVQTLVAVGATVVAVVGSPEKATVAASLEPHATLDASRPDWPEALRDALDGRPVRVGLDGVGGQLGRDVLEHLAVGGRLVMYGMASGQLTALDASDLYTRGVTVAAAIGARLMRRPGGLRDLETRALGLVAAGRVRPLVRTFPLADAGAAHEAIERRETVGKTVLVP